jgi:hypothetical protein
MMTSQELSFVKLNYFLITVNSLKEMIVITKLKYLRKSLLPSKIKQNSNESSTFILPIKGLKFVVLKQASASFSEFWRQLLASTFANLRHERQKKNKLDTNSFSPSRFMKILSFWQSRWNERKLVWT